MNEGTVSSVNFDEEGQITLTWHVEEEIDDEGGNFYQSIITGDAQAANDELAYWIKELTQAASEVLGHWRRHRRKKASE